MRLISKLTLLSLLPCLGGTLAVATAAPLLRLSTSAKITVDVKIGTAASNSQVQIYNAGDGSLSPTFATSAAWLQATLGTSQACGSVAAGLNCMPVNIAVDASALASGTYAEVITVSDPNAVDSPQTIPVNVNVLGVPSNITLYAAPNGGRTTTTFQTQSPVNVQPSATTGGNWLAVALLTPGVFSVDYPYQVSVTTQAGQGVGDYTGAITVSGSNYAPDNKTISVLLHVTSSPILSLSSSALVLTAGQGSVVTQNVSIGNAGGGSLSVTGATTTYTSGSGWLTAAVSTGGGNLSLTATTASLTPGIYQATVAITSNAANTVSVPVTLLVTAQTGPVISYGGVVNIGDNTTALAPGDIASAYGTQLTGGLAPGQRVALPLDTTVVGTQVLVNGTPAGLYYVSDGQINFQVPYETASTGPAVIQIVSNGKSSNMVSARVANRAPRILQFYTAGAPPIIVDYTTNAIPTSVATGSSYPSQPAHPGDVLVMYAVGLGQTTPAALNLAGAPGLPTLATLPNDSVHINIGGLFQTIASVTPQFVGLAPGFASLYQINFVLPEIVPTGNVVGLSFMLTDGATVVESNNVNIAIE